MHYIVVLITESFSVCSNSIVLHGHRIQYRNDIEKVEKVDGQVTKKLSGFANLSYI